MPLNYPFPPDIAAMKADVFREIWRKIYFEDDSQNIIIVGPTGKGKSTIGLYVGWSLDRNSKGEHLFSIKNNVFHKFTTFIKAILNCKRKGQVFILEEAGTKDAIYKREWFTVGNKAAAELMQIARRWNLILIFILPARKYLDTDVRDYFDIQIVAQRKDLHSRRTYATIKYLSKDPERAKEYAKYPTLKTKGGLTVSATLFEIPPPPQYLIDEWKEYEAQFKGDKLRTSVALLEAQEQKELESDDRRGGSKIELDKWYDEMVKNPPNYTKENREKQPRFNWKLIYANLRMDNKGPGEPTCKILAEKGNKAIEQGEVAHI